MRTWLWQAAAVRIRILEPMKEGRLYGHDLTRFTPTLVYDVEDELGTRLIEMGVAMSDRTGAPAVVLRHEESKT